eukprot:m.19067 g.19067  ORF g.19067 m.19067 type:complete len:178 (-) comp6477_c0_seq2:1522-2055(-)
MKLLQSVMLLCVVLLGSFMLTDAQTTTAVDDTCPPSWSDDKRPNGCSCYLFDDDDHDADYCDSGCCANGKCESRSVCNRAALIGIIVGSICLACCCFGGFVLLYYFFQQVDDQNRLARQRPAQPVSQSTNVQYHPPPPMDPSQMAAPPAYDASVSHTFIHIHCHIDTYILILNFFVL